MDLFVNVERKSIVSFFLHFYSKDIIFMVQVQYELNKRIKKHITLVIKRMNEPILCYVISAYLVYQQ